MTAFPDGSPWVSLNGRAYEGWRDLLYAGGLDDFVNGLIPVPEYFCNPGEGFIITQDTELQAAVEAGEQLSQAIIYNSGGGWVHIDIGTCPCCADLYSGTIAAHEVETIIWNKVFSLLSSTDIYFSSYNWNGAVLKTVIQTELIFI